MKYLSLERDEYKELISLRLGSFSFGLIINVLVGVAVGLICSYFVHHSGFALIIGFLTFIAGLAIIFYSNKAYFSDLTKKEKRVYKGVLAQKKTIQRNNKKRFLFNVDGFIFFVDEDCFSEYKEGELLELHISPEVKHLFKIERVA